MTPSPRLESLARRSFVLAGLTSASPVFAAASPTVRFPKHSQMPDPQRDYMVNLLGLALTASGMAHRLAPLRLDMNQHRTMLACASGEIDLDVMWTMPDPERERGPLLPVRIPTDKGLLGWRCLLVRATDLPRWRTVSSLAGLRDRVAGQGHDWPDTEILRANGLQVGTSSHYEALFRMLERGRIDYFPRSIIEIDGEAATFAPLKLAIVPKLLLHYPATTYFFVNPRKPELAERLRLGLEACIADGSMTQLFARFYGGLVARHKPASTRVLELRNPLMSAATPLGRRELWL